MYDVSFLNSSGFGGRGGGGGRGLASTYLVVLSLHLLEAGAVLVREDEEPPISERTPWALWWLELLPLPLLEDGAVSARRAEEETMYEVGGLGIG